MVFGAEVLPGAGAGHPVRVEDVRVVPLDHREATELALDSVVVAVMVGVARHVARAGDVVDQLDSLDHRVRETAAA